MTPRDVVQGLLAGRSTVPRLAVGEGEAPANIALVKYWGKRESALNLPVTGSLSIGLRTLGTRTQISVRDCGATAAATAAGLAADVLVLNDQPVAADSAAARRLSRFLDLVRPTPAVGYRIETWNSIPTAAGLASSASGFAALVLALDDLYGWALPEQQRSVLARMGSGSACRSLWHGFVRWNCGEREDGLDSYAVPLAQRWPDLRIGLLAISHETKPIGSRDAMNRTTATSALYSAWPQQVERDLVEAEAALVAGDFAALGRVAEHNAMAMHATMIAAWPPVCYWQPETLRALHQLWRLRADGLRAYATMDAGPNIKLLFQAADTADLVAAWPDVQIIEPFQGIFES